MRRHAKASTAESTQSQAAGLGRFFRGALATRDASPEAKGGSAPAAKLVLPVAVFATILATMALIVAPAGASKTHLFKKAFGSAAQPSFGGARGIAVDQSTGDVLVMDAGTSTIRRYNPDGTAANFSALGANVIDGTGAGDETPENGLSFSNSSESQIAVDNSGTATDGDIYVTQGSPNVINIFSEEGEYLGRLSAAGVTDFSEACGVAVDPSGAVYVGDYSGGIHKFVPAANPPVNADNTATFSSVSSLCALAAGAGSSAGYLFAAQYNGPISKLDSSSGELKYTVSSDSNTTLTVDPGTGHVYGASGASIEEFDASGIGGATSVSSFATASEVQGVAVRGASGDIYLDRANAAKVEVFGSVVTIPGVTTDAASNVTASGATIAGTVNPDGVEPTECKFEYGPTAGYGQSIPCAESPASIGSGSSPVPVHADLSGLEIGTVYHFRLFAKNANGSAFGTDQSLQSLGPVVKDEHVVSVVFAEATVGAQVNPEGSATIFRVEFGTDTSYGKSTVDSGVGSDSTDHPVTAILQGLQPATTYHWRVVATNSDAVDEGPDHTFTTYPAFAPNTSCSNQQFRNGPSATLPDCRAYEMVSPVDKNGGDVVAASGFLSSLDQSSTSGQKFTYSSYRAFGDAQSAPYSSQYVARRGAHGWTSEGISPARGLSVQTLPPATNEFKAFSPDLSTAWVWHNGIDPLAPNAVEGYINIYRRDNSDGSYEAMTTLKPSNRLPGGYAPEFQGSSSDGSHAIFRAQGALTPDAPSLNEGSSSLYEWVGGELRLVAVLPNGEPSPLSSSAGTENAPIVFGVFQSLDHAISDDGSRIFWTAKEDFFGEGKLYVRIDGKTTVPVSESVSSQSARFWTASADGSKVIFETNMTGPVRADKVGDLYEFDVETETPTLIAHEVSGLLGAGDDVSYIYLVSREALDAGATAGRPNLYLYHAGAMSFIGTLAGTEVELSGNFDHPSPVEFQPRNRLARVSADGRHVAFVSAASLTGYDNTDVNKGTADAEVYIYDADTEQLTCVSCNPSGARPVGGTFISRGGSKYFAAARISGWKSDLYDGRNLSEDGKRLFFESFDPLVPQDTNGVPDVYEWEAQGAADCQKAGGCVSLLSTGKSTSDSEFVDASPSGDDVFIRTESSIDPRDPGLVDIYDIRVGGGLPYTPPPLGCIGDACQSAPEPPNDPTPASAGFRGAGNPVPRKARRNCAAQKRHAKGKRRAKSNKKTKRCKHTNRRAVR